MDTNLLNRTLGFLEKRRERIIQGNINSIPSPFIRFREDFLGIEQEKYIVVTARTKESKTQLTSYMFLYTPILFAYEHKNVKLKIFYFNREETDEDILIRFMSYLLYTKKNIRVNTTDLKSSDNEKPIKKEYLQFLNEEPIRSILEFFCNTVEFVSISNPTGCYYYLRDYAESHGRSFKNKVQIKDEFGNNKDVYKFDHYEMYNPNEYRIVIDDHLALIGTESGFNLKQSMDKMSEYHVILRNRYKYTIVAVIQQAFAGESFDAIKLNLLRPSIANIGDSKYAARNANIVLGIYSPFRFEVDYFQGYDIKFFRDNIRFLEVLINRSGTMGGICPLYFDGAVNFFKELPKPDNVNEMALVKNHINIIRGKKSRIFFIKGFKNPKIFNRKNFYLKIKNYFCKH